MKALRKSRWIIHLLISTLTAVVLVFGPVSGVSHPELRSGAESVTLTREPQQTPDGLGAANLDGLQFADPAAQIDLVQPPIANNQGDAQIEHVLSVPPGRAGLQPDTTRLYSQDPVEKVEIHLPIILKGKIGNAPQDCDGGDGIYLYETPNYTGECRKFTADCPNFADVEVSFLNKASSIRFVGSFAVGDYQVLLCEQANYEGVCIAFRMDNPDVNPNGSEINGIQSLIIEHVSPSQDNQTSFSCDVDKDNGVFLYQNPNYQGECRRFTADHPNFADSEVSFLNKASSIQFKGSYGDGKYRALVCARAGYKGVCSPFRGDDSDFGTNGIGHDNAQSIIVEPTDAFGESLRIGTYNIQYMPWTPADPREDPGAAAILAYAGWVVYPPSAPLGFLLGWLLATPSSTGQGCCDDIAGRDWKLADRIIEGEYDIIAFNEGFQHIQEPMKEHLESLYPYGIYEIDSSRSIEHKEDPPFYEGIFPNTGSGLMLASQFPIEPLAELKFDDPSTYECDTQGIGCQDFAYHLYDNCQGDDCLADKGVAYTRIKNPVTDRYYNILFTHLDGNRPTGIVQLGQVKDLINETKLNEKLENELVIIMGDLNFTGELDENDKRSEWENIFKNDPFFSVTFSDTWEAQQGNLQPDDRNRAHGYTAPVTYSPSPGGNRFDYIVRNQRQDPELCVQHVSVAYNMRHGAPYYEGAFGSVGYQDLSDHYGLNADINLMAPHCSPQQAYPVTLPLTPTVAATIPATITNPGNMQWFKVDQPGTYSINLVGNDFLDFQVYKSAHLSAPLPRYYSDAKNPYSKLSGSIGEEYTYHIDDGPFYIRVFSKKRSWTGPYELIIRKHAGFNTDDAILLLPGQPLTTTFPVSGGVTSTEQWFQIITGEPNDSSLDQTLHFEAVYQPTGSGTPSFTIISEDGIIRKESESGAITINENTNNRKFYMVVRRNATDPEKIRVEWETDLAVMHETPEHPIKLYAESQTEKDWFGDDDEIEVRISADDNQVVRSPEYSFDTGQLRGLGDIIPEPIRFVNKLQIQLEEQDSFLKGGDDHLAADDIGPSSDLIDDKPHWVDVPERGSHPTGFYRFHLNLGRHSYGTPEGLASNPGPAICAGPSDDKNGDGIDDFVLYVGQLASQRNVEPDTKDERITVQQLNPEGTQFLVSCFGRQQIYPDEDAGDKPLQKGAILWADAGTANDIILLKPLQIDDNNIISFTVDSLIIAGEGHDMIRTGEGNDEIHGGKHVDILHGGGGHDLIYGEADPDFIYGGDGPDDLIGGSGKDFIYGEGGGDIILGDGGEIDPHDITHDQPIDAIALLVSPTNDPSEGTLDCDYPVSIFEEGNADCLYGGDGNDIIFGEGGHDTLLGGAGNDYLTGNNGEDNVQGDDGNDIIYGETGDDTLEGGNDNDLMYGNEGSDQMSGDAGTDIMLGDNGLISEDGQLIKTIDPQIGGEDTMHGNSGDDIILGGAAGDDIWGNPGADVILGDHGHVTRDAQEAVQRIETTDPSEGGEDTISGGIGADLVFGGTNSDTISGDEGHDILLGDHGLFDDSLPPNQNFVAIFTGAEDGGAGDTIHGNDDDDIILGQQGTDHLYGDAGQDDLTGGHNVPGGADDEDMMYGESDESPGTPDGSGADVMIGDNGVISRTLTTTGTWQVNPSNQTYTRVVQLYDVEMVDEPEIELGVYGDDKMWGNSNDDIMYGQGGEDIMHGGAGDDYMEGNAASDLMYGEGEDDDMVGGTGPTTSNDLDTALPGRVDASTITRTTVVSDEISVSLGDEMYGGAGADVMLGDNGIITRAGDAWEILDYTLLADSFGDEAPRHFLSTTPGSRVDRQVQMIDTEPGKTSGSDLMFGGPGEDDMYGQFDDTDFKYPDSANYEKKQYLADLGIDTTIGDELYGEEGEDAMLGDNGVIDNRVLSEPTQEIAPHEPFFEDERFVQGSLIRDVTLDFADQGGEDRMLGGPNGDWMHGGAGNDLMNGNPGNDRLFGDDGEDVLWGGFDHDHLYGGYGNDYLDVKPRPEMTVGKKNQPMTLPPDLIEWFAFGEDARHQDNYEGVDYIYGGWDQDAMQADQADHGPVPGDRLIDWVGAYNVYYLCPALYGEFVITRDHSPAIIEFLQQLAEGDGASEPANRDSSGFNEVAIVFPKEAKDNSHPVHPDHPGHFTCE